MSQLTRTLKRGWVVLREEGPVEFLSRAREYARRIDVSTSGITVSYQTGTRVDFEERWQLLEEQVSGSQGTVLDIGCAEGHLTARFAERGFLSLGIERQSHTVAAARKSNADQPNLGFLKYEIDPDSIDSLPSVDVILLLTVYHHWVREFGWEDAEAMLRSLGENCELLFFEIPNHKMDRPALPDEPDEPVEPVEYYETLFETIFEDEPTIEFLGETDYKGEDRQDLIYALEFDSSA